MKNIKKITAAALSVAMVLATPSIVKADGPSTSKGTGAIYSFNVEEVIVPTSLKFAANPQNLDVYVNGVKVETADQTGQILSLNYGIVNKSTKDKVVEITFATTVPDGVTLTNDRSKVDGALATDKDKNIMIQVAAASAKPTTTLKEADGSDDKTIEVTEAGALSVTAAELANIKMAKATAGVRALAASTKVTFKLAAATYGAKTGDDGKVALGTATNDVKDKFQLKTVPGVTGFTFTGYMNKNADWSTITSGTIGIEPTYKVSNVTGYETAIAGTAGEVGIDATATISTTDGSVVLNVTGCKTGEDTLAGLATATITAKKDGKYQTMSCTVDKNTHSFTDTNYKTQGTFSLNMTKAFADYYDSASPVYFVLTMDDGTVLTLSGTFPTKEA